MLLKKADDAAAGEDFSDDPLVLVVASPFFCGMVDGDPLVVRLFGRDLLLLLLSSVYWYVASGEWRVQDRRKY